MKQWTERTVEEAYLLNPAFCCAILAVSIQSFEDTCDEAMPFALAYMLLPIILHKSTRESLPRSVSTSMPAWLLENANARVLYYERLISLKPHTREALLFGIRENWVKYIGAASLSSDLTPKTLNKVINAASEEVRECLMRARFLGKWFATAGSTNTIMAFWGIQP